MNGLYGHYVFIKWRDRASSPGLIHSGRLPVPNKRNNIRTQACCSRACRKANLHEVSHTPGGDETVTTPRPFTIHVPDEALADLRMRLERTRWPDENPGGRWQYGSELAYMKALLHPPRAWVEAVYPNLLRWTMMPAGGHFAALEEPEALAADVRAFFRQFR